MRMLPLLLLVIAVLLAAFAHWGACTRQGAAVFDEMAGMIPVWAGMLSGVFVLAAAVLWWWRNR